MCEIWKTEVKQKTFLCSEDYCRARHWSAGSPRRHGQQPGLQLSSSHQISSFSSSEFSTRCMFNSVAKGTTLSYRSHVSPKLDTMRDKCKSQFVLTGSSLSSWIPAHPHQFQSFFNLPHFVTIFLPDCCSCWLQAQHQT